MSDLDPTRREILLGSIAATVLLTTGTQRVLAAEPLIRPDISSAAGQSMTDLYALAVKAMQVPEINYPPQPHSWTFQAYIHAVPLNPFDPANSGGLRGPALKKRIDVIYGNPAAGTPQAAWKQAALACWATCNHGSPYFTTWHRWYLYYFERICRKMSNHPEFMLPYWNYASDTGTSLQLPDQFRAVSPDTNNPNVLFFDDRGLGFADGHASGPQNVAINNGGFMPFTQSQYGPALGASDMFPADDSDHFSADPTSTEYLAFGFTGRVECVPHDLVHGNVGGWMSNVPSAAGDPIFYMHHCQIDRLYASWESKHDLPYNWGNTPSQPDEDTWKKRPASFVDETGALVAVKLGEAINTSALGYGYDALAAPPSPEVAALVAAAARSTAPLTLAAMKAEGFHVQSGGTTVTLTPQAQPEAVQPQAELNATRGNAPSTLVLKGIKLLRRPPAPLSVFINLPKGTAPQLNGPYYVGTLNLFNFDSGTGNLMVHSDGDTHADHAGAEARFDVTKVLQDQRAKGLWDGGPATVTISTIGADTAGTLVYVTIDSAAIVP